jgi:hypothetical protein
MILSGEVAPLSAESNEADSGTAPDIRSGVVRRVQVEGSHPKPATVRSDNSRIKEIHDSFNGVEQQLNGWTKPQNRNPIVCGVELELRGPRAELVEQIINKLFPSGPCADLIQFFGFQSSPEAHKNALELNTKRPVPITETPQIFFGLAKLLKELIDGGHPVALGNLISTQEPRELSIESLSDKPRTKAVFKSMIPEVTRYPVSGQVKTESRILTMNSAGVTVCSPEGSFTLGPAENGNILTNVERAGLAAIQVHLNNPSLSPAANHNAALLAQLFGMFCGGTTSVVSGVNTGVADLRAILYKVTSGRRAPMGNNWFSDYNILGIFDEVLLSENPSLNLPSDAIKGGYVIALQEMKQIWAPLVRPTVTHKRDGGFEVHPELRALGTPATLQDCCALQLFISGLFTALPDYLRENFGVDLADTGQLEKKMPYGKFLDSIWSASLEGLEGQVTWFDGEVYPAKSILEDVMFKLAEKGLIDLGVPIWDRTFYLGGPLENVRRGITTSSLEQKCCVDNADQTRQNISAMLRWCAKESVNAFLSGRPFFAHDAFDNLHLAN